jgi:TetR/AcrR family transcriptional regulator, regulator of cefoperazone and chloramphenicol sensitivity
MRHCPDLLRPTLSKSDLAKARLLDAALEIFGNKGFKAATVREIARAAGQNVAAIEYHFGGKDKLYQAVLGGIIRELRSRLADVVAEIAAFQSQNEHPKAEALRLLKSFLTAVYLRVLSRNDALPLTRLMVREQMHATAAFRVLYDEGIRHLHQGLCVLVGAALGTDPRSTGTILQTHTIMGQFYFFAISRETVLRRAGWKTLEGKNADLVVAMVCENIDILMAGLAAGKRTSKSKGEA